MDLVFALIILNLVASTTTLFLSEVTFVGFSD